MRTGTRVGQKSSDLLWSLSFSFPDIHNRFLQICETWVEVYPEVVAVMISCIELRCYHMVPQKSLVTRRNRGPCLSSVCCKNVGVQGLLLLVSAMKMVIRVQTQRHLKTHPTTRPPPPPPRKILRSGTSGNWF